MSETQTTTALPEEVKGKQRNSTYSRGRGGGARRPNNDQARYQPVYRRKDEVEASTEQAEPAETEAQKPNPP